MSVLPEAARGAGADPLPARFYARPADAVAPELLGTILRVVGSDGHVRQGRIVEVEAYLGEQDRACHAHRGFTRRTRTLYGPPGTAYVYLVYGVHELFNVVCQPPGVPHAVLVRAVELLGPDGLPAGGAPAAGSGPGKLTRSLGIGLEHDGADLTVGPITIHPGGPPVSVAVGPRVGVAYAGEWADAPLRFWDPASPAVSRPPRSRLGNGAAPVRPEATRRTRRGA